MFAISAKKNPKKMFTKEAVMRDKCITHIFTIMKNGIA